MHIPVMSQNNCHLPFAIPILTGISSLSLSRISGASQTVNFPKSGEQ